MRAVVTGATSFIGTAVVLRLLEQGAEVLAVVRPGSENLGRLTALASGKGAGRLKLCEWDLCDIGKLPRHLRGKTNRGRMADAWVHIGWSGPGSENRAKREVQQANVTQSLAAVRAAAALGCRRFLFTGSQAEYGICHGPQQEDLPCHPVSEYGKAKADFAGKARGLCKFLKIEYIHTRIFSVYGPGDHPWSLVNSCLRTWQKGGHMQLGECTQQWNFLYIDDAAEGLCRLLAKGRAGVYNLAGTDTRPLRSYIEELYQLCGSRGSYAYGKRPQNAEGAADLNPDISRICGDTGWRPRISFAEGVRRLRETEISSRKGSDML